MVSCHVETLPLKWEWENISSSTCRLVTSHLDRSPLKWDLRDTPVRDIAVERAIFEHGIHRLRAAHVPFGNILDAGNIDVIEAAMQTQDVHLFFE